MALSEAFAAAHIANWQAALNLPYYAHRRYWPECLFHHAPLENAAAILRTGTLRSRNDPENALLRDVAARDVNAARAHAHDFVRLYFRPKTPTQYHIEGIRKEGECQFGDETHAPVLVMFVVDAQRVLTLPHTQFCDRNMQRLDAVPGGDEAYFGQIPFASVYHEGPTGGDEMIPSHRCAEVLAASPLDLEYCLRAIYCRSEPERDTLLDMLGPDRHRWVERCYVSDALKVFEKRHSFVQEVGLSSEGVFFTLNRRFDGRGSAIRIAVRNEWDQPVANFHHADLPATPPQGGRWIYNHPFPDGHYRVSIEIEGHLAYDANILLQPTLF